ncbi:MAG: hypothetical protein K0R22_29 [Sporomusa sp.]|nr:hypothetical protein [Sporomusa sp.]
MVLARAIIMERTIEKRFKREVEKRGAKAWKFVSPGMSGVPDRIVLKPGGRIVFVEMKDEGKNLEPLQMKRAAELEALGFTVYCIDSVQGVEAFIQEEFADGA